MFFTAQLAEAVTLRSALTRQGYDGANIAVLEGFDQPDLPDYSAHQLTPVINHSQQAEMLAAISAKLRPPCLLSCILIPA